MAETLWVKASEYIQATVPDVGDTITLKFDGNVTQNYTVIHVTKEHNSFTVADKNSANGTEKYTLRPNGRWVAIWCSSDAGPEVII